MNTPSNGVPESPLEPKAPALSATRPLFWSIRRELWENRSVFLAPLAVAALVLFALSIGTAHLPRKVRAASTNDPAEQHLVAFRPYGMAPAPIMFVTFLVGMFYALDALHGERRDRSILFWKSLPVSDLTTVLSKASVPLVVLPLIGFALCVATLAILMVLGTVVLLARGLSPAVLWGGFRVFLEPLIMLYGMAVFTLWFAPIYGWLLLISAWARRTPLLWATLPLFAIAAVEHLAFATSHFGSLLRYRVAGAMAEAFALEPAAQGHITRLAQLDPARFLSSAGLWSGLALAALFLALAVRVRHRGEPI